jgi:hypothetical protein
MTQVRPVQTGGESNFLVDQEFTQAISRYRTVPLKLDQACFLRHHVVALRRLACDDGSRIDLHDSSRMETAHFVGQGSRVCGDLFSRLDDDRGPARLAPYRFRRGFGPYNRRTCMISHAAWLPEERDTFRRHSGRSKWLYS